jgi:hypothetical protein
MSAVKVFIGILLLLAGRKIYWLFVALVGFAAGLVLGTQLLSGQPEWVTLFVALICGIIGAVLAKLFQRLVVGIAGFVAGAWIVQTLLSNAFSGNAWLLLVLSVAGGVISAVFVSIAFDWTLILLSSGVGALLITQSLPVEGLFGWLLLVVLFILGSALQFGLMRREKV